MNSEYSDGDPSSSTCINANFLSGFLNLLTGKFRMSRGRSLLMDVNPKVCEVEEHISTKV